MSSIGEKCQSIRDKNSIHIGKIIKYILKRDNNNDYDDNMYTDEETINIYIETAKKK